MEQIEFGGQMITFDRFDSTDGLESIDPKIIGHLSELALNGDALESHPMFLRFGGVVVDGNLELPDAGDASVLELFASALNIERSDWIIFRGNIISKMNFAVPEGTRVAVLGDLKTVGLCNIQKILLVGGSTLVTGGLMFDSNNGGLTRLNLADPAGIIATTSNFFSINLKTKYFFDPIFKCGFEQEPRSPHEENILEKFETTDGVKLVGLDDIVEFFVTLNPQIGDEIRKGGWEPWMEFLMTKHDSSALVTFLDAKYT